MKQDIVEMLDEIQSICIGADSPDAIENGKNNPADELEKCRQDLSAISDNVEKILEQVEHETSDRKYTKGDCYAICEFLENLLLTQTVAIAYVADELGYETNRMVALLSKLANDINDIICDEQDENDYTEQMAEIMELKHIKGE